jgi:acetyltransferase-like isoleucine patch superfamily enzyme
MKQHADLLYFVFSVLAQVLIAVLLGIAAIPSIFFIRWAWQALPSLNTIVGALGYGLSIGLAFLLFGNSLLVLILAIRNLFGLRNHEQRAHLVSMATVNTALYNLMLHVANQFFLSVLKGSYLSLLFYRGMGAKIGRGTLINTHRIWDCDLLEIGENCIIGGNASIAAHVAQGARGHLRKVRIGNNVTIGANTSVMAGVTIEDNVVVGANSLVPVGAHLEAGKTYIGVPAKPVV